MIVVYTIIRDIGNQGGLTMFCPHCHNKIPDGSNFCPLCYANLVGVRQRETESAERFEEEEKPRPAQKAAPKKSAKPAYSKV